MEYKKGDVLEVKRGLYSHYGVYVGNGQVIHFSADNGDGTGETNPFNADIIKTDIQTFQKDCKIYVDNRFQANYSPDEIVNRAESLIGSQKGKYNLAVNNCEHFANWCKTGNKYSHQVDEVKEVIPHGEEIYSGLEKVHETVVAIEDAYDKQTGNEDEVYNQIDRETERIVQDYNDKSPEVSTETWVGNTFGKLNPIAGTIEYVKNYIDDVNKEIDDYDQLKKDYNESSEKGIHPLHWFRSKTQSLFGEQTAEDGDFVYYENTGDYFEEKARFTDIILNDPVPYDDNPYISLETEEEAGRRESILVVATGLKVAGSTYLHMEVPNSITVPVAACAVDCSNSIKKCASGDISVPRCVGECTRNVIVATTQIIRKAPEAAIEIGTKLITKVGSKISTKGAVKIINSSPITQSNTRTLKSAFKNTAVSCISAIKNKGKKIAGGIKSRIGKIFSGGRRK